MARTGTGVEFEADNIEDAEREFLVEDIAEVEVELGAVEVELDGVEYNVVVTTTLAWSKRWA